jgi:SET domain-containing protein
MHSGNPAGLRRSATPGPPRVGAFTGVLRRHPGLEVRLSNIAGYGVFTREALAEGDLLEECLTLRIELGAVGTGEYVFEIEDGDGLAPLLPLGYGALYNHSDRPSAEWEFDPDTDLLSFFAARDVAAGEELLFDYGRPYWETRPDLHPRVAPS